MFFNTVRIVDRAAMKDTHIQEQTSRWNLLPRVLDQCAKARGGNCKTMTSAAVGSSSLIALLIGF